MMKLSYMWDGHPTTFVVLSRYCLFHSLCAGETASHFAIMSHINALTQRHLEHPHRCHAYRANQSVCLILSHSGSQLQ